MRLSFKINWLYDMTRVSFISVGDFKNARVKSVAGNALSQVKIYRFCKKSQMKSFCFNGNLVPLSDELPLPNR